MTMKRLLLFLILLPGVLAYDLSDYPGFLFENGSFNAKIVVGANAPSQDVASAILVIPSLQELSEDRIKGALLDEMVSDYMLESNNMISFGCENSITEQITGYGCQDFKEGHIYLLESKFGKAHMVIAGRTPDDTQKAAAVLGLYENYSLSGNEIMVSGEFPYTLIRPGVVEETEEIEEVVETEEPEVEEEKTEEPPRVSRKEQELRKRIEDLSEDVEVESVEKEAEETIKIPEDASTLERLWFRFKNWLSWFFK